MCISKSIKCFFRHNGDAKLDGIKHHIRRIGKQRTIIRQSNQTTDMHFLAANRQRIPNSQIIVISIHTINGNFRGGFRKTSVHQANLVNFRPIDKNTKRTFNFFGCFLYVKILVNVQVLIGFQLLQHGSIRLLRKRKVSIFNPILFKAFVISRNHTVVGNQKAGNQGDQPC